MTLIDIFAQATPPSLLQGPFLGGATIPIVNKSGNLNSYSCGLPSRWVSPRVSPIESATAPGLRASTARNHRSIRLGTEVLGGAPRWLGGLGWVGIHPTKKRRNGMAHQMMVSIPKRGELLRFEIWRLFGVYIIKLCGMYPNCWCFMMWSLNPRHSV